MPIAGEDFLVFGDDWGFHPTTTQHLFRQLSGHNRVLWMNLMGLRAPQLNLYTLQRGWGMLSHLANGYPSREEINGLKFHTPLTLPLWPNRVVRWWNRRTIVNGIRRRSMQLGFDRPIFFAMYPNAADVLGKFQEKLVVYYCLDEYAEMPFFYTKYVRETEEKILERADLVFVTSSALVQTKSRTNRPALLLPQGVEFEHFARFQTNLPAEPMEFRHIPHPRLGFVGLLAPWVDLDLLVSVAQANREASVILIGPPRVDCTRLKREKNIYILGPRPYVDLPRYMAHLDVGLIPFRINALTKSVNPLKLLEYMAMGLPVVSTALPEVLKWKDVVYCAEEPDEFVALVGAAARGDSEERRERRIAIARANSWERRVEQLSQHLEQALGKLAAA